MVLVRPIKLASVVVYGLGLSGLFFQAEAFASFFICQDIRLKTCQECCRVLEAKETFPPKINISQGFSKALKLLDACELNFVEAQTTCQTIIKNHQEKKYALNFKILESFKAPEKDSHVLAVGDRQLRWNSKESHVIRTAENDPGKELSWAEIRDLGRSIFQAPLWCPESDYDFNNLPDHIQMELTLRRAEVLGRKVELINLKTRLEKAKGELENLQLQDKIPSDDKTISEYFEAGKAFDELEVDLRLGSENWLKINYQDNPTHENQLKIAQFKEIQKDQELFLVKHFPAFRAEKINENEINWVKRKKLWDTYITELEKKSLLGIIPKDVISYYSNDVLFFLGSETRGALRKFNPIFENSIPSCQRIVIAMKKSEKKLKGLKENSQGSLVRTEAPREEGPFLQLEYFMESQQKLPPRLPPLEGLLDFPDPAGIPWFDKYPDCKNLNDRMRDFEKYQVIPRLKNYLKREYEKVEKVLKDHSPLFNACKKYSEWYSLVKDDPEFASPETQEKLRDFFDRNPHILDVAKTITDRPILIEEPSRDHSSENAAGK
jgi:hypothetical protein